MLFRKHFKQDEAPADGGGEGGTGVLSAPDPAPAAEPVAAEPVAAPIDITFPENWKDAIEAEYRDDPAMNLVPDIPTLVKNYIHAQKNIAKKGVALPDQHSTDDDRRSFFQQLGLPQSLEKYEVAAPKDASFEDGFLTEFKRAAYDANILPEQSAKLLEWYNSANANATEQMMTNNTAQMQTELQALKQEWGSDYENKTQIARSVLRTAGLADVNSWLEQTGLDNSSMMIKLMSQVGELMKEDGVIDFGDNVGPSGKEIQTRIDELEHNFDGPLYNKKHPNHAAAVKEKDELYNLRYPSA